ncbi:MAG TPA: DMT family transporter [Bdellovibrionota bacterium]|nr:DMT family transporter [Bdellovibrionota bacterium]
MNSLGPLSAFGCAVTWAIGASYYSRLSKEHGAFAVNFTRACFGFPLFVITVFLLAGGVGSGVDEFRAVEGRHVAWFFLSMICSYGLGDACFMWASRSLGAPGALAVASCYPLWTTIAGFVQGERLQPIQLAGVALTVAGVVTVILNAPGARREEGPTPKILLGVMLALLTSFFWALNTFAISHMGRELTMPVGNSIRLGLAFVGVGLFGLLFLRGRGITIPGTQVKRFAGLFVLESFVGTAFFFYGMAHSPLAVGSTLASLAPAVSVPVALALGLEKFVFARALGIALAVAGVACLVAGG